MNFKELAPEKQKELADLMFLKLDSPQALKNWIMFFLGLDMPIGTVDPDSNSSPIDAMWEIYDNILHNRGDVTPGYIMLSARECYKCQIKGSKLLSPAGLVNIEDVKVGDTVWSGFAWQKVINHIYDGFKAGITLEVDGGLSFTGSPIHRYWALRNGEEQWIKSNELNAATDLIAINVDTGLSGDSNIDQEKYDTGYFLGLLAGDGSVSAIDSLTHRHFNLTTIDPYIKDFFISYVKKTWGSKIHLTSDKIGYAVWDKKAIDGIKELGVKPARSWEKEIPAWVYSNVSAIKGFIAGLFDTDGSFTSGGQLIISITSLKMLQDVQKALVSFGVLSRVRSNVKKYGNSKHLIHSLTISHSEIKNLEKTGITFLSKKANPRGAGKIPNTHDTLPKTQVQWFLDLCDSYGHIQVRNRQFKKRSHGTYLTISVDRLLDLCSWMEENAQRTGKVSTSDLAQVAKMRNILRNKWRTFELKHEDSAEFYDLTVENDHSYWSNGSISHNTLGASILETLLMLHFEVTIAHMAAIQAQSAKAVQYINYFFAKVEPLLESAGWVKTSENKGKISYRTKNDEDVYIRVIVATMAGANCVDPAALVMVENKGEIPAVEIEIGDRVLTRNYKTGLDEYVTSTGMQMATKSARKITLESGRKIVVSDDHPIFTDSGWIRASQVKIGSKVVTNKKLNQQSNGYNLEDKPKRDINQLILGTLLGDASIHKLPSGRVRYSVYHSKDQVEYIDTISEVFRENGIECNICADGNGYKLTSKTSELLNKYYELTINSITGKKTVNSEWLASLNNEGIAYWIMDDGRGNPQKVGSYKEHCFSLATCGFSEVENRLISNYFNSNGYKNKVSTVTNQSKKIYNQIEFSLESSRILSEQVSFYFVKSLRYKLLSTVAEATQRWALDSGEMRQVNYIGHKTLYWDKNPNLKHERELKKRITSQYNDAVSSIELLGYIDLVDIAVDTEDKTLHSFFANGILVHNSEHTSLMFVDEIDVVANPQAYEEAKLIPGYTKGIYPLTVKLSTRKFAFGLMQKELDMAPISGDQIVRWNILDVTERCPDTRHKPELPKDTVYTAKSLPLRTIDIGDYEALSDPEKPKWERQENVHAGCVGCKLLPVCKTRLSQRPLTATGGLYKPIQSVINQFKKVSPDMAEAQLLCWKPSSKGLVYPRFEGTINEGNVITLEHAWTTLMGEPPAKKKISEADLIWKMQNLGIRFFAGVDWGYAHDFVIVIFAQIPNGEWWIVDCYSTPGLEFSDCLEVAKSYRDRYHVERWFCDTAMPSHLKSFNKNYMKSPQFTKDVMGGIEALRSKIVGGDGRRLLKVLYIPQLEKVIKAFQKHHFKLGTDGNPTLIPDDTPGTSDQADAMRYVGQNMFPIKGPQKPEFVVTGDDGKIIDSSTPEGKAILEKKMTHNQQMRDEVAKLTTDGTFQGGNGKRGGFHWSM